MKAAYLLAALLIGAGGARAAQVAGAEAGARTELTLRKEARAAAAKPYRVQPGDSAYKILRREFETTVQQEIAALFDRLKQLNPAKTNWNLLIVGESLLVPVKRALPAARAADEAPTAPAPRSYVEEPAAEKHLSLIRQVLAAAGSAADFEGEEIVTLPEGSVFIDRSVFPIFKSPFVQRRVILDPARRLPEFLRSALEGQKGGVALLSITKGATLREVVEQLLARLGYELLPANRPVTVQDRGAALLIRGDWMAMAPIDAGRSSVWIINLSDEGISVPERLKAYLALKGVSLSEIADRTEPAPAKIPVSAGDGGDPASRPVHPSLPAGKAELLDALLGELGVPFESAREFPVALAEGVRIHFKVDRYFELKDTRFGLLFGPPGGRIRSGLTGGLRLVDMDLDRLSSREVVARLLATLGKPVAYKEHSFPFGRGRSGDRLVVTTSGFFLADRRLLLTDREMPEELKNLFSERGMKVAYFE